jgi:hypothetical protein
MKLTNCVLCSYVCTQALGGDSRWMDRFLARHAAIVYYWALNALFLFR